MNASTEPIIAIRGIESAAEIHAIEELQKEVWRIDDLDVVPGSHLVAAVAAGGVLFGAFDSDYLVGFVYGFVGYENGQVTHHSHMLGIKPEFRNSNLGQRLKLAQRERVLEQGIELITWTFDPLQSLNAHINFGKLGVVCDRYFVNFYGEEAASFLHRNGTDRLWVTWLIGSRRVNERIAGNGSAKDFANVEPLIDVDDNGAPRRNEFDESDDHVLIAIPPDINEIENENVELAAEWREATRSAFTEALEAGYLIEDFFRPGMSRRETGAYLLSRGKGLNDID